MLSADGLVGAGPLARLGVHFNGKCVASCGDERSITDEQPLGDRLPLIGQTPLLEVKVLQAISC